MLYYVIQEQVITPYSHKSSEFFSYTYKLKTDWFAVTILGKYFQAYRYEKNSGRLIGVGCISGRDPAYLMTTQNGRRKNPTRG